MSNVQLLAPAPVGTPPGSSFWNDWYEQMRTLINSTLTSIKWSIITGTPTTISGYGITDAVSLSGVQTLTNKTVDGLFATGASAPTIASASTIAPTTQIAFVSGTTSIATITAPSFLSGKGGQITLIPTGLFVTLTSGNIALASTAVVNKALIMTYDSGTGKWYPSY